MARVNNRMTNEKCFRLVTEIKSHAGTAGNRPFSDKEAAEAYFSKVCGFSVHMANILSAVKIAGVELTTLINVTLRPNNFLASVTRRLEDMDARIKLAESRIADLDRLVKS